VELDRVGLAIKIIDNAIKKHFDGQLARMDLSSSQLDLLVFLLVNRDREINQKDIEAEFGITNPTVTGLLGRLEAKGLVTRQPSSSDARCKLVQATERAQALSQQMNRNADALEATLTQGFAPGEREQFLALLRRVLDNLQANGKED
jgi:MarR family multiple gene transcriptional regulator MgrA